MNGHVARPSLAGPDYNPNARLLVSVTQLACYFDPLTETVACFRGVSVIESEFQMLDVARKTDFYGMIPHTCQDDSGTKLQVTRQLCVPVEKVTPQWLFFIAIRL